MNKTDSDPFYKTCIKDTPSCILISFDKGSLYSHKKAYSSHKNSFFNPSTYKIGLKNEVQKETRGSGIGNSTCYKSWGWSSRSDLVIDYF